MQFLLLSCLRLRSALARGDTLRFGQRGLSSSGLVVTLHLALFVALSLAQASARAETQGQHLSVLRAAPVGVDPAQAAHIDAALHAKLAKLHEFSSVQTLPVPLEDLSLAAGCRADDKGCLQLMAQQLEAGTLLVRQLVAQPDGSIAVTLLVQDRALEQGEPWRAEGVVRGGAAEQIDGPLQRMLTQLFPQSVELAPAPRLEVPGRDGAPDRRWRAGWSLSALGVGLLTAGLTTSLLSRRDERTYAHAQIAVKQDVDDAHTVFARAERRARLATFFGSAGAVVTAAGVGTLLWRWAALRSDTASATVGVQPAASGAMITVDGTWRGGR